MKEGIVSDPPGFLPKIKYETHEEGADMLCSMFPGLKKEQLPGGGAWSIEQVSCTTHAGTHLDAPWHYGKQSGGVRAITIDEVPLEWCFQRACKLDFVDKPDGHVVSADEVQEELDRIGHTIEPLDIVLVNTRAGKRYGLDDYLAAGCGMGREATMWLLDRGVRVTGIDGWSWDAPFVHTRRRWDETGDPSIIWEGHYAGCDIAYCHMEKLGNLESLPSTGFYVSCFPVKLHAASGAWTRAVAFVPP